MFVIVGLGCGKRVMSNLRSDYLNPGQRVATMSWPDIWRMVLVNCDMKSRWLNLHGEHSCLFWCKAKVNGLWSVRMVTCRASSI